MKPPLQQMIESMTDHLAASQFAARLKVDSWTLSSAFSDSHAVSTEAERDRAPLEQLLKQKPFP